MTTVPAASAVEEDSPTRASTTAQPGSETHVNLEGPEWETVLDRLFGTPDSGGLLDGTRSFEFRAEGLSLTAEDFSAFLTSPTSPATLAALTETTQALHGTVRLEGTIDGQSFELKIAGHELKLGGLTLTSDQLQALVAELKASGLHQMKIEALVDGEWTVAKVERSHEKLEIRGHEHEDRGSRVNDYSHRVRYHPSSSAAQRQCGLGTGRGATSVIDARCRLRSRGLRIGGAFPSLLCPIFFAIRRHTPNGARRHLGSGSY